MDLTILSIFVALYHSGSWYVDGIAILLASVLLPFYVGYVRGAMRDSVVGQIKGWIYLMVGTSAVLAVIQYDFVDYNGLGPLRSAPEWIVAVVGLVAGRTIGHRLLREFPEQSTLRNRMTLVGGAIASYLSPVFYIIAVAWLGIIRIEGFGVAVWNSDLLILWVILFAAALYLVAERTTQGLSWEGADLVLGLQDHRFTIFRPGGKVHRRLEIFLRATEIDVVIRYVAFGMNAVSRLMAILSR